MQIGKNNINNKILGLYPSLTNKVLSKVENALCPFSVELPANLKTQIETICNEFINYKKQISSAPWADSVLNSLDFHYSSEKLKIIEANTNASGFLLSNALLSEKEQALDFENTLLKSFKTVFKNDDFKKVFIVDEDPQSEKMYTEFLMFKDFFDRNGVSAEILKTSQVIINDDEIYLYNRDNDFYLERHLVLKALWQSKKAHLSTSPFSYQNIADKKFDLTNDELLNQKEFSNLQTARLETLTLTPENKEELWARRKKLFFKPSSSFGSKGVYAGKSVSRKKFDEFENGYLAQELHPPGKTLQEDQDWKYDIRAFFSENGSQKIIARLYQGQLTNFSNLGGGFALIKWVD